MNRLCPNGLAVDHSSYAGGLAMMPPGGWLDVHLDCDRHRESGYRRAMNAILFLDDWQPEWGGELELWNVDVSECDVSLSPRRNRLIVFEVGDLSYHGIPTPIRSPGVWRRSLGVYWWEPIDWQAKRPRAQFVAIPGDSPEKDAWRAERGIALAARDPVSQ